LSAGLRAQDAARAAGGNVTPAVVLPPRLSGAGPRAARGEGWERGALVLLTLLLFSFGVVELYSASAFMARADGLAGHHFAVRQLLGGLAGVVLALVVSRIDYRRWAEWSWPFLGMITVLLVLLVMPGTEAIAPPINGARRWLNLGVSFQPSEFAKLALIFWPAGLAGKKQDRLH
jgi:cell division protein FtsW (lipid II flippase)